MAQTTVTLVTTKQDDVLDPYIKILQNQSNDIDVSFSSYLKPDNNIQQQKEKEEDTELSIFEARSYFSESSDKYQTKNLSDPRFSSVTKVSSLTIGQTTSSEASWNSQTGLLKGQGSDQDERGSSKKGARWFFRRRICPCSNAKSVQVQESKPRIAEIRTGSDRVVTNRITHHHHQKISSPEPLRLTIPSNPVTWSIEAGTPVSKFSFPILNETSEKPTNFRPKFNLGGDENSPKNPVLNRIEPVLNPIKPILDPTSPKGNITDEEATSDASSDLFEIESFSTQHPARQRVPPASDLAQNSIDESHETITEYEPSEASITWSVMTAEPASVVTANFSRISLSSVSHLKSVSIQKDVLCNNGSSKLCVTSSKSSFLV